jgi:hypothetical protein
VLQIWGTRRGVQRPDVLPVDPDEEKVSDSSDGIGAHGLELGVLILLDRVSSSAADASGCDRVGARGRKPPKRPGRYFV